MNNIVIFLRRRELKRNIRLADVDHFLNKEAKEAIQEAFFLNSSENTL